MSPLIAATALCRAGQCASGPTLQAAMRTALVFLVATAALAAASRDLTPYGRLAAPETQDSCCQDGVPVCSQVSLRLHIPDLGCELLCRASGHPGSLGCSYRPPVPACGCRNDPTGTTTPTPEERADDAGQPQLRMLATRAVPTAALSRTRFY